MKDIYNNASNLYNNFLNDKLYNSLFREKFKELIDSVRLWEDELAILKKYDCSIYDIYKEKILLIDDLFEKSSYRDCLKSIRILESKIVPQLEETKKIIQKFDDILNKCRVIEAEIKYIELPVIKLFKYYSKDIIHFLKNNYFNKLKIAFSILELETKFDEKDNISAEALLLRLDIIKNIYIETSQWEIYFNTSADISSIKMQDISQNIKSLISEKQFAISKKIIDDLEVISIDREVFLSIYSSMNYQNINTSFFNIKNEVELGLLNLNQSTWNTATWYIIDSYVDDIYTNYQNLISKK